MIYDLTETTTASSSISVSFTEAQDATRYHYRINSGSYQSLSESLEITGLNPSTTYTIEVRGVNNSSVGLWSNAITSTTTP